MNTNRTGVFVRPTALGAALFAAATKPGTNHPAGFVVKRIVAREASSDRDAVRNGFSVLEKSSSPKKPEARSVTPHA